MYTLIRVMCILFFCTLLTGFTCRKPGMFVFTFDDGVSKHYKYLLNILSQENVKATFFVIGKTLTKKSNFDMLSQAYKDGHVIGNHTWEHRRLSKLTEIQIEQEINATQSAINLITSQNYPLYIRPPYGSINKVAANKLNQMGYTIIYWDIDAMDWSRKVSKTRIQQYYDRVIGNADPKVTSFVSLQHDRRLESVELVPYIIKLVRAKGFKIVNITECLSP